MTAAHVPIFGRLLTILLVSGYCSLVYQMVWLRLLRQVFGASTASSAAVVAIFMGGLGLGGWILGSRVDRTKNPLRFYAGLETAIALSALITPPLVELVSWWYVALGGTQALGLPGGTVLRMALVVIVLGPATFFMGGTLPAAARAVERVADRGRRDVGLLYGVNTLGAVTGALWTTFVAVEWLGLRKTLWLAVLLNLLIAVFARALSRVSMKPEPEEIPEASPVVAPATAVPKPGRVRAVLAAAGVVGFAFFLMELVWYRMLAPILGGSSYTFGLILAVALAGIGAGGLAYGYGRPKTRPTFRTFAATCALQALAMALPLALGDRLAFLALELRDLGSAGFPGLVFGWAVVTFLVVFPASFVAGYQFPVLIALLGSGRRRVGREVGQAYAWNTAGAILGSLAGGFGFLPWLSAPGAWRLAAGLLALLATATLVLDRAFGNAEVDGVRRRRGLFPAACAVFAGVLLLAPGPSAVWRHSGIGAGRMTSDFDGPNGMRRVFENTRANEVWEADGRESSVALQASSEYAFLVNGKSDGSARGDAPTTVWLGLVGAMLHPEPRTSMVIGLGTGTTAGWLADVATMERVDVAEIEPIITRVAEVCDPVNRGMMDNPKVHLQFGDARELLMTSAERYDLIVSEPSNPYRAGISSLFSREFYRTVSQRLTSDGLFLQWLQGYEIDASVVRTAYATLASVFPHVETWQVHRSDLVLVAALEPIEHDVERIRLRVERPPFRSALVDVWGVHGIEGFYSGYAASPEFTRWIAAQEGGRIATDDHPIIEFGFARNLGRHGLFPLDELTRETRQRGQGHPPELSGTVDWDRVREADAARHLTFGSPPPPSSSQKPRGRARHAYAGKRYDEVVDAWHGSAPPEYRSDRMALAHSLAVLGAEPGVMEGVLEHLAELQTTEATAVRGLWHARRQEDLQAARVLEEAFDAYRTDPWPHTDLMAEALSEVSAVVERLSRKDMPEALTAARRLVRVFDEPFAVALLEQERQLRRLLSLPMIDFESRCLEAFQAVEPHPPWLEMVLRLRLRCYRQHDHSRADEAEEDLLSFLDAEPPVLFEPGPTPVEEEPSAGQNGESGPGPAGR